MILLSQVRVFRCRTNGGMKKMAKLIIVCLIAVFSLTLAGCSENTDIKNESSIVSLTVSGENEKTENDGIELPEEEFDSDEESGGSQNTNTKKEDDGKTSSSGGSASQNTSSTVSDVTSSTQDDESSKTESEEDNISSNTDTSEPSQNEDGSIELPMDMW